LYYQNQTILGQAHFSVFGFQFSVKGLKEFSVFVISYIRKVGKLSRTGETDVTETVLSAE
jgi:hypothetical protein